MFGRFFDFINKKYGHDFISYAVIHYNHHQAIYACKVCDKLYFTNYAHDPKDWDAGISFENLNYEFYKSLDENDFDYIEIKDLLTCGEQMIKNLLE